MKLTPLHCAVNSKARACVKLVRRVFAPPAFPGAWTLACVVTSGSQIRMCSCAILAMLQLIEAGANFEAQTDTGERPLHLAIQRMDMNILIEIIEAGADRFLLYSGGSVRSWLVPDTASLDCFCMCV